MNRIAARWDIGRLRDEATIRTLILIGDDGVPWPMTPATVDTLSTRLPRPRTEMRTFRERRSNDPGDDHQEPAAMPFVVDRCPHLHRRVESPVEFVEAIVIESFWISILTAVLLVALLDVIRGIEHRVTTFFAGREGTISKIVAMMATRAVAGRIYNALETTDTPQQ